jgi:hypothetical protein
MWQATEILQWAGCATGVMGASLLASKVRWAAWGFVFFLASNLAWGLYGWLTGTPGMVLMQTAFTLTSLAGIFNWLIVPLRSGRKTP